MERKDWITLSISLLALLVSGIATWISASQSRHESERAIETQLGDALNRLTSLDVQRAELMLKQQDDPKTSAHSDYYRSISDALDRQKTLLLQETRFLIDRIPALVTSVELTAVASFTYDDGDYANAEKYHLRAIKAAPTAHYKLMAEIYDVEFLFQQHEWEKARNEIGSAISSDTGNDDLAFADRGFAY
jgi:hypothetical protein